MVDVTQYFRDFLISENSRKKITVKLGEGANQFILRQDQIIEESLELTEALCDDDNFTFVGCISSMFKLKITGVSKELEDMHIEAYVSVVGEIDLPLFFGRIESAKRTSNKRVKEIIAYDELYYQAKNDVTKWFDSFAFDNTTISQFREDFFGHIGITQKEIKLKCDDFIIPNPMEFVEKNSDGTIYAIDIMKSICQLVGRFGIMNRYGEFEYRMIEKFTDKASSIPSKKLLLPFILMNTKKVIEDAVYFPSYRKVDFSDFDVKNINTVHVMQEDGSDIVGHYGNTGKKYTVSGNLLTRYASQEAYQQIAEGIYNSIKNIRYTPFTSVNIGLPFVEVGDAVQFYAYDFEESERKKEDVYTLKTFIVLKRVLTGIMSMKDTYSARGVITKEGFLSDLGYRNKEDKVLEKKVENNTERIEKLEGGAWNFEMVDAIPSNPAPNTIYFLKGTAG